ncbi:MAG: OmpH family outer membrane protein [Sphingomonas sp.]|nr:OmpH family outer membrane protein [Sphingomonas sp.]
MKTILSLAALGLATVAPTAALAQQAPPAVVVVVDGSRIYRDCTACKTAQTQLQARVTALTTRQRTLSNQLRTESQPIEAAVRALNGAQPDAALRTRITAFQTKQDQANQELQRSQENLQSIQANVLRQINARFNPVMTQVMTARGANIAVDVSNTLAHSGTVDVTAAVLAGLNAALTSVTLTPLPANAQQQPPARPAGR